MNTHIDTPLSNTSGAVDDVIDNYPEYLQAALGYRYGLWQRLPEGTRLEHDRILQFGSPRYEQQLFDPTDNDLMLLALTRHHLGTNDPLSAFTTLKEILKEPQEHCEIEYQEIWERMVMMLLKSLQLAEDAPLRLLTTSHVQQLLYDEVGNQPWKERQHYYQMVYKYLTGADFEGSWGVMLQVGEGAQRFEMIEDLLEYLPQDKGQQIARRELERLGMELKESVPNHPLLVDIDLLLTRLS